MQEILLFLLAVFAGTIDAIAGGGGLIVIPGLMMAGFSPLQALAVNKLQAVFGAGSAALTFWRRGELRDIKVVFPASMAFIGSAVGAAAVSWLSGDWLIAVIPWLLIGIAIYLVRTKSQSLDAPMPAQQTEKTHALTCSPAVGFYDGFFGPGAGTFYTLSNRWSRGFTLLTATALAKWQNTASNLAALVIFIIAGLIDWRIGLLMALGQTIGGFIGARLASRFGARLIRNVLLVITLAMSVKLLFFIGN